MTSALGLPGPGTVDVVAAWPETTLRVAVLAAVLAVALGLATIALAALGESSRRRTRAPVRPEPEVTGEAAPPGAGAALAEAAQPREPASAPVPRAQAPAEDASRAVGEDLAYALGEDRPRRAVEPDDTVRMGEHGPHSIADAAEEPAARGPAPTEPVPQTEPEHTAQPPLLREPIAEAAEAPAARARAPVEPVPEPEPARKPVVPTPRRRGGRVSEPDTEVRWWRGYLNSKFYAFARIDGDEYVVAESPDFRWRKPEPPPEDGPAGDALRALVEDLEQRGWVVVGRGEDWFSLLLRAPR